MPLTYSHLSGSIVVDGSITASGGFSGSIASASYATTASFSEIDSSRVDHDATTNFVALEHIDHSAVSVNPGQGLTGGGTIQTDRSLALDGTSGYFTSSVKNVIETNDYALVQFNTNSFATTGSNEFTGSQIISGALALTGSIDSNAKDNKIRFHYDTTGDLPSATSYHGMFAHVHGEAAAYYAHGGDWVKLADDANKVNNAATASFIINSQTSSFATTSSVQNILDVTGSFATTSSVQNLTDISGSFATTGSNIFSGSQVITGSLVLTGSAEFTGSLFVSGAFSGSSIYVGGGITAGDDITSFYSSDENLKDNIELIPNAVEKVKQIKGVSFIWNDMSNHSGHDVGVIAQDIEKVLPELVVTRENGFKAVKYDRLVALLIQVNKELIERIEKLENR